MKPICIIPARSGSKGLPDKNMLFLAGKPMIFHTIDAAIETGLFEKEDIFVSTDSDLYRDICLERGISVVMRKPELSSDTATSYDMMEDFLADYEDDQVFVLLQVTSPLRKAWHIEEAVDYYTSHDVDNVVSFSEVEKHPRLFSTLSEEGFAQDMVGADRGYRRQDLQPLYYPNGAIYISDKQTYLKNKSFFTPKTYAYKMAKEYSLDVDTRDDFIHVIGHIFFDYDRREQENKELYRQGFKKKMDSKANRLILGDSRTVNIDLEGFANYSQGGLTLSTLLENIDIILTDHVKEVFLSIGVNDFITNHSIESICKNFEKFYNILVEKEIKLSMTTVAYTLFRETVKNSEVHQLNNWLNSYCHKNNIALFDINEYVAYNDRLDYQKTTDGLHFKDEVTQQLQIKYQEFLAE
ncbi:N-acylneuraminate cytidylyltransferase [Streptococcus gallinaceus]|uniref:cytidylyltransferase domain-containing protein n=1 Tax=Streptococcus gallinaceus TaxID=165758 RepID=UPI00209F6A17|nr:GDSL-type esterase/lipase family protein [Streptococcus gallinaceus]MCP1639222.1 N-acylneuraminate cytidylyltransferase [Streptococcus gallinaceus]MCP1770134.1 N-acylneuraminate cytidylyltransferase [Streptococcus gallinaceus]